MSEKTMFNSAVEKIQTAFQLLRAAREELAALGIKVNTFEANSYSAWGFPDNVFLTRGLNRVSVLAEKEIESINEDYGKVMMDGFFFDQPKLPVAREDRYA